MEKQSPKKVKMNLPNKLTIFRMLLVPAIIIVYAVATNYQSLLNVSVIVPNLSIANLIIVILFAIGVFTDFLDGHIARKYDMVTNFGKFTDPLADKLLVMTVLIILLQQNSYNLALYPKSPKLLEWWMLVIILAREFMVTGVRMLGASNNRVIAASKFGKYKALAQYITIILILLGGAITTKSGELVYLATWYAIICKVALYITIVLTVFSGVDYIVKNKDIFNDQKKKEKIN